MKHRLRDVRTKVLQAVTLADLSKEINDYAAKSSNFSKLLEIKFDFKPAYTAVIIYIIREG